MKSISFLIVRLSKVIDCDKCLSRTAEKNEKTWVAMSIQAHKTRVKHAQVNMAYTLNTKTKQKFRLCFSSTIHIKTNEKYFDMNAQQQ